jgi:hypothetical protein
MFLAWVTEIAKTFAFALVTSLIFLLVRAVLPAGKGKATGFSRLRTDAYSLIIVGFFQIVLAVLLSRIDIIYVGGQMHVSLLR